MKAIFAVGDVGTATRLLRGHSALMSYAYIGTRWVPAAKLPALCESVADLTIDSGAFTAWRQDTAIDLGAYTDWLVAGAPPFATCVALDVIGDADASVRNWREMLLRALSLAPRLMPVWHECDPPEHLDEYVARSGIVGLGRIAGRRSQPKTFTFYDEAFNRHPDARFHALGNASPTTLEPYPFASFDSTGWQLTPRTRTRRVSRSTTSARRRACGSTSKRQARSGTSRRSSSGCGDVQLDPHPRRPAQPERQGHLGMGRTLPLPARPALRDGRAGRDRQHLVVVGAVERQRLAPPRGRRRRGGGQAGAAAGQGGAEVTLATRRIHWCNPTVAIRAPICGAGPAVAMPATDNPVGVTCRHCRRYIAAVKAALDTHRALVGGPTSRAR